MKDNKEVLTFLNEFTFYDFYKFERVMEFNHMRDYMLDVLSENDFLGDDHRFRLLGVIDDTSLMIVNKIVETNDRERNISSVDILQLLCLEKLCDEGAGKKLRAKSK